ncbi:hypothetical protein CDEST_01437 [Colletotrichum destructivum]|uniref:Uncharacterized protein n=1 Tax=Colletotrichum destructivum TaxID=34406 RepID=A0AAX4I014_9PEZI|nr:hypothetical protein CDEST_01437 [Colletotrichum destructivum]
MFRIARQGALFLIRPRPIHHNTILRLSQHHSAFHNHYPLSLDMEDSFFDDSHPAHADVAVAQPDDGEIPEGLVSARREKFTRRSSHRVAGRMPSPQDARERESTWFG